MKQLFIQLQMIDTDVNGAMRRFTGHSELYEHFLIKFIEDGNYSNALAAVEQEDWPALLTAVHTLKGVAASLGFNRLLETCSATVNLLRKELYADAKASCDELGNVYYEIIEVLVKTKEQ